VIIVQTPLRVSFFGGGTDFPAFFREEGGCVLSTAINKYIYVTIKERFDDLIRVGYTRTEIVERVDEVQHELIREALRTTGVQKGIEITTMGDIPAGTGLGSSSAVTIGALQAMYTLQNRFASPEQLAREACEIEITRLGKPIGIQDQYIAAYGGIRFLEFCPDGSVTCENIEMAPSLHTQLRESLILFYTGVTREAGSILGEQNQNSVQNTPILREMKKQALQARNYLCSGDLEAFGSLLDEAWRLKKQLASKISNGSIEEIYQKGIHAGALGGKITGAGGGGFLLFFCPLGKREAVRGALSALKELPINLERDGSKVIFNYLSR
jgi:D-glycero-alpha-D-manno-heptose-7-phosphate kinase